MDTLGERLQKALDKRGKKAAWLVEVTGKSKQTIYNIVDDTTQPEKITWATATRIALALGVDVKWLITGKGAMEGSAADDGDSVDIPAYRLDAALGDGAEPDEYAETHALKFRAQSLRNKRLQPSQLGVVYGKGDSMTPRIKSGDAILFDRSDCDPKDGLIYVISYDGDLLAKRLSLLGGRWFIESLNTDDPKWRKPKLVDELKQFDIRGRVRWIGSWED